MLPTAFTSGANNQPMVSRAAGSVSSSGLVPAEQGQPAASAFSAGSLTAAKCPQVRRQQICEGTCHLTRHRRLCAKRLQKFARLQLARPSRDCC